MSETEDSEVSIHSENEINKIKTHSDIKKIEKTEVRMSGNHSSGIYENIFLKEKKTLKI